jgi:rod shape-determining protein MreD
MQQKSHAIWVIFLSFFIAYLLAIVPFPEWAMNYRPEWVPMVLIYWVMALPYRIGIGSAWSAGLILDILEGVCSLHCNRLAWCWPWWGLA